MPSRSRSRSRSRSKSKSKSKSRSRSRSMSRSRSRSRSKSGSRSPSCDTEFDRVERRSRTPEAERNVEGGERMTISDADAAFVLGKGGKTKEKIARVAKVKLDLSERQNEAVLEIKGTDDNRRRARKYIKCVMAQRVGPVTVDLEEDDDGDLTIIPVPTECIGFVTGKSGNFLRQMEEEWGTLMFFAEYRGREVNEAKGGGGTERLAIFGDRRGQRGAELKVMSAVEQKLPGHYTRDLPTTVPDLHDVDAPGCTDEWGTDTLRLRSDELSYALGRQGMTRRKLAKSSGCIVEYVGHVVHLSGTSTQRKRSRQYLKWLFMQLEGPVNFDWKARTDCTTVDVPSNCVGYVMGARRETLGKIEEEWGTLMFFLNSHKSAPKSREAGATERLAIFGPKRARRGAELKIMSAIEAKEPGYFTRNVQERLSSSEWGTDSIIFSDQDLAYALGKDGTTRRKLARASGCIMEYVGHVAYLAGLRSERKRARQYLKWLLKQRGGQVFVEDATERHDLTMVHVPKECIGYVTGNRGSSLRQVEEETGTFCFVGSTNKNEDQLLIFGYNRDGRHQAERMVNGLVSEKLSAGSRYSRSRSRSRSRGRDRRSSPSYDRYDRRRSPSYDRRRRSPSYDRRRSPSYDRYRDRRDRSPDRRGGYDDRRNDRRDRSRSDSRDRYRSRR